jgi:beta-glucosidase/6-phospho-beta-glucosidase/beta-galactosidase
VTSIDVDRDATARTGYLLFGLLYADFDSLERTPKLSAQWFREAARQNRVE